MRKLIRDKIPDLIKARGESEAIHQADEGDRKRLLIEKLHEEAQELLMAKNRHEAYEEMADILEVVDAIQAAYGFDLAQVSQARALKNARAGKFEKLYVLETKPV